MTWPPPPLVAVETTTTGENFQRWQSAPSNATTAWPICRRRHCCRTPQNTFVSFLIFFENNFYAATQCLQKFKSLQTFKLTKQNKTKSRSRRIICAYNSTDGYLLNEIFAMCRVGLFTESFHRKVSGNFPESFWNFPSKISTVLKNGNLKSHFLKFLTIFLKILAIFSKVWPFFFQKFGHFLIMSAIFFIILVIFSKC